MFHGAFVNPFDLTVYHAINGLAGHVHLLDVTMIFFAKYALEIYAVLFITGWFVLPKRDIDNRHALFVAGLSGVLALGVNMVIAHVWFRPRPFTVMHKGTFTELVPHSSDASFPSDHVAGSFGFASASWGHQQKWLSWSFTTVAVVVMFARVYVGVHYPTDVIGGMLVGILSSQIVWRFSKLLYPITVRVAKVFGYGAAAANTKPALGKGKTQSM